MRQLGIDFGTKKIGLALTDEAGKMAFPHSVIPNDENFLSTVVQLMEDQLVTDVVVGHSLANDGTPNAVHADVESFIADLTLRCPIPIHLQPEQFTTAAASRLTGKNDQTDAAAAALILESWLQKSESVLDQSSSEEVEEAEDCEPEISFDQFTAVEIRLGTIQAVEAVEGADKLLKLKVDLGEKEPRQIVSGIREYFPDEQELVGKQCPFVTNLAPRKIRGVESQGMILAGQAGEAFAILHPNSQLPAGTRLY